MMRAKLYRMGHSLYDMGLLRRTDGSLVDRFFQAFGAGYIAR